MIEPCFLGIEGGGTHTTALLAYASGRALFQGACGPGNVRLLKDDALKSLFRAIARKLPAKVSPASIAIGMAGARTPADKKRITSAAAAVWKGVPCLATNDLETALMAAPELKRGATTRVLVLSGTGSCCFGRTSNGFTAKVGGWGHLLGDQGSGHDIGMLALQQAIYVWDRNHKWGVLGRNLLAAQQLNEPNDLIAWVQSADKASVAALAEVVFRSAASGDALAKGILDHAADSLASDALLCADRLAGVKEPVQFDPSGVAHPPCANRWLVSPSVQSAAVREEKLRMMPWELVPKDFLYRPSSLVLPAQVRAQHFQRTAVAFLLR